MTLEASFSFFPEIEMQNGPGPIWFSKAIGERKKKWTIIFHMTENMMRAESAQ